ncbi:GCN5-related N-acetyltransferase [Actinobacteria bacterium OK074]|nr:GCN5-related N-acetyltransferase [Actinobacteria bacterium OK074]
MTLTVRPAVFEDAPAVRDLLNAVDTIEIGRPETDLHTVEDDLRRPGVDLARDSWVALAPDGRIVSYGLLWDEDGGERIDIDHYVLPDQQAAGVRLLELMQTRAAERAAANGAGRAVVHLYLNSAPTLDTTALGVRGWQVVRQFNVLTRAVTATPAPAAPPGVTVRVCTTEADRRRAHVLLEAAFVDHFEHHDRPYDQWLAWHGGGRIDWSLVWLASANGGGDLGALLARDDDSAMGWIRSLGVLSQARGRGIGGHLLQHAFAAFAARGRDTVGLGVDTENTTDALRLYEHHGMKLHYAVRTWQVELPVSPTVPSPTPPR